MTIKNKNVWYLAIAKMHNELLAKKEEHTQLVYKILDIIQSEEISKPDLIYIDKFFPYLLTESQDEAISLREKIKSFGYEDFQITSDEELKNKVIKYRAKNNLTQVQFAQLANVSEKTINNLENGNRELQIRTKSKIIALLNK